MNSNHNAFSAFVTDLHLQLFYHSNLPFPADFLAGIKILCYDKYIHLSAKLTKSSKFSTCRYLYYINHLYYRDFLGFGWWLCHNDSLNISTCWPGVQFGVFLAFLICLLGPAYGVYCEWDKVCDMLFSTQYTKWNHNLKLNLTTFNFAHRLRWFCSKVLICCWGRGFLFCLKVRVDSCKTTVIV